MMSIFANVYLWVVNALQSVFSRAMMPLEAYALDESETPALAVPYTWKGKRYLTRVAVMTNAVSFKKILTANTEYNDDVVEIVRMWAGPYNQLAHTSSELGLAPTDVAYVPLDDYRVKYIHL